MRKEEHSCSYSLTQTGLQPPVTTAAVDKVMSMLFAVCLVPGSPVRLGFNRARRLKSADQKCKPGMMPAIMNGGGFSGSSISGQRQGKFYKE